MLIVEKEELFDRTIVRLRGVVDDNFDPQTLTSHFTSLVDKTLVFDFAEVTGINSWGVRSWLRCIRLIPADLPVLFRNCPVEILDQIAMMAGFIPNGGFIESYYLIHYCSECGNEEKIVYQAGDSLREVFCVECKTVMDADMASELNQYFKVA